MKLLLPLLVSYLAVACIQDVPFSDDTTQSTDTTTNSDGQSNTDGTTVAETVSRDATSSAQIVITPSRLDFGMTTLAVENSKSVRVVNAGDRSVTVSGVAIADATNGDIWALRDANGIAIGEGSNPLAFPRVMAIGDSFELYVIYENLNGTQSSANLVVQVEDAESVHAELTANVPTAAVVDPRCLPDMLSVPGAAFGALAIAPWGKAFVVPSEGGSGLSSRLGEIDLATPSWEPLSPVGVGGFAAMQADWIEVDGDNVSVYEFYPTGQVYTFDRVTRVVTTSTPETVPGGLDLTARRGNVTWGVRIGAEVNDICGNVCIVKTPDGGAMEVFLDDAGDGYKIHTNHVSWHGDHVYFMSYNNPTGAGSSTAVFRRAHLDTGVVEAIVTLDPTGSNAWVHPSVLGPDGRIYWIRVEHDGQGARAIEAAIDAYDPRTGTMTANHVTNVNTSPRGLALAADGTFVWVDALGIRSAPFDGGQATVVRPAANTTEAQTFYTAIVGNSIWYTHTVVYSENPVATFGCVSISAP